jgi:hypothetical protein
MGGSRKGRQRYCNPLEGAAAVVVLTHILPRPKTTITWRIKSAAESQKAQLQRDSFQWQDGKSALMLSCMKDHRQPANRSKSYAKITSVRTSFRFYAKGPRALGKTRKHADVSKPR